MNGRLVHRGPDSDGLFTTARSALAVRRLSIIDLERRRPADRQRGRHVVVVQNGEIYNYRELATSWSARGHRFATALDTEVLAHLYEEHGDGVRRAAARHVRDRRLGAADAA